MNETCANGCIPSSPRVGCPVHGPKAKPPEPEDLPHPGTGRLLSASPVKSPEPAPDLEPQYRTMAKDMEDGPARYIVRDLLSKIDDLRAQLAAAQACTEKLKREVERRDELLHGTDEDLKAATERADEWRERSLRAEEVVSELLKRAEKAEREFSVEHSFAESAMAERDAAIKAKEEAETEVQVRDMQLDITIKERDAERKRADEAEEGRENALRKALEECHRLADTWPRGTAAGPVFNVIAHVATEALAAPPHGKDAEEERPTLPTDEWVADAQTWAHGAGQESSLRDCLTIACEVSEARWAVEDIDGATAADEIADRIRALCPSAFETLGKTEERPRGYIPREAETLRAQRDALKESYWRQRERVEKLSRATCALLGSDREETLDAYLEDDNLGSLRELVAQRDALQDLIHTAAGTLDIVAASPQDFVTHVLLLREERDELKARLTEAEGLLREYLRPGRNSPEDLDGENRAFLKEATP